MEDVNWYYSKNCLCTQVNSTSCKKSCIKNRIQSYVIKIRINFMNCIHDWIGVHQYWYRLIYGSREIIEPRPIKSPGLSAHAWLILKSSDKMSSQSKRDSRTKIIEAQTTDIESTHPSVFSAAEENALLTESVVKSQSVKSTANKSNRPSL